MKLIPSLVAFLFACGGATTATCPTVATKATPSASATASPTSAWTPKGLLEKIVTSGHADPSWFQAEFLAQVPTTKIDEITQRIIATSGAFKSVSETPDPHKFVVAFEHASWDATIILEGGKIQTLFVKPSESMVTTLDDATTMLRALTGKVAFTIYAGSRILSTQGENDALAVGSALKLPILVELRDRIEKQKKLSWDRVVTLDPKSKSLPSGMLQNWPDQSSITVQALASLMISISDNTATDNVIHLLGRASLAKYGSPHQVRPFLTTGDAFRLKAPGNEALLERFRAATPAEREKVLVELETLPLPKVETYPKKVTALDVEWFFSPHELCGFMGIVHDLPLMGINPGVAKKSDWDRVAYKGGSEPGVISMTTWVEKGAKAYCVSAIWNDDKPVDDSAFTLAYGAVLGFLAKNTP